MTQNHRKEKVCVYIKDISFRILLIQKDQTHNDAHRDGFDDINRTKYRGFTFLEGTMCQR